MVLGSANSDFGAVTTGLNWRTSMSAQYPVLPVAGGTLLRAFASLLALVTQWLKELARARRHRREANALAGLDRRSSVSPSSVNASAR